MCEHDSFDKETIADVLAFHGVDEVEQLPQPVQNNLEHGPDAEIEPFDFLEREG